MGSDSPAKSAVRTSVFVRISDTAVVCMTCTDLTRADTAVDSVITLDLPGRTVTARLDLLLLYCGVNPLEGFVGAPPLTEVVTAAEFARDTAQRILSNWRADECGWTVAARGSGDDPIVLEGAESMGDGDYLFGIALLTEEGWCVAESNDPDVPRSIAAEVRDE